MFTSMRDKTESTDILELRKFLGKTQESFASLVGVSVDAVRKWEQGKAKPSHLAMEKLGKLVKQLKKSQLGKP